MPLVDTHCHLQDAKFDADREDVLARSFDTLDWLVIIGDDLPTSRAAVELTRHRVFAAVGVHPYHAISVNMDVLGELRQLAANPAVKALGEIGLDYYNESSPHATQLNAFKAQLELAVELGLPVVIHNRDADEDTFALLKEHAAQLPACIMHCFGSDAAFAARCIDLGFYISFAGNVTFPKAQPLRDAAAAVTLERLLVETDAPYLSPQPKRGKRCEPHYVQYTAALLAELKGVDLDEFVAVTTCNASVAYHLG